MVVLVLMVHAVVHPAILVNSLLLKSKLNKSDNNHKGLLCDTPVNPCAVNPCQNNGLCLLTSTGYQCQCSPYYTGPLCNITLNPCDYSPCQNGGQCQLLGNISSFNCACPSGIL
jgi:hypothetical protein